MYTFRVPNQLLISLLSSQKKNSVFFKAKYFNITEFHPFSMTDALAHNSAS